VAAVTGSIEGRPRERQNSGPEAVSEPTPADPATRRAADIDETRRASQAWWDANADDYQREHGRFLGNDRWIWGPEGLDEAQEGLLGSVTGQRILEVGCGAAAGSHWLRRAGAWPVGIDISHRQLQHSRRLDEVVPVVVGDAERLPFADASFDGAAAAYGALPFVADAAAVMAEVARVLRPGSRWVFSVSHPIRWCFPDDPSAAGLTVNRSYFDRRAYVEQDADGRATYVEHHRTVRDWVRLVLGAGFTVVDVVEPEWPDDQREVWGGWSPLRGRALPGTLILVCQL
jgi:SAM-dependent methyltransferase